MHRRGRAYLGKSPVLQMVASTVDYIKSILLVTLLNINLRYKKLSVLLSLPKTSGIILCKSLNFSSSQIPICNTEIIKLPSSHLLQVCLPRQVPWLPLLLLMYSLLGAGTSRGHCNVTDEETQQGDVTQLAQKLKSLTCSCWSQRGTSLGQKSERSDWSVLDKLYVLKSADTEEHCPRMLRSAVDTVTELLSVLSENSQSVSEGNSRRGNTDTSVKNKPCRTELISVSGKEVLWARNNKCHIDVSKAPDNIIVPLQVSSSTCF